MALMTLDNFFLGVVCETRKLLLKAFPGERLFVVLRVVRGSCDKQCVTKETPLLKASITDEL